MGVSVTIEDHLQCVFAFSPKDWGANKDDAWLYGIICGWDEDSIDELRAKFGWTDRDIDALKFRRKQFLELEGSTQQGEDE